MSALEELNLRISTRESNATENIYVDISEPMSVTQLMAVNMFEEDYYHYNVLTI